MVFSFAWIVIVTVEMPDVQEYDEYQYDEPQDGFQEDIEKKEVDTNEKFEMITKPLNIVAVAGDKVELPCMVDKLPSGVGIIWERPDVKQIVSIGDNLIKNDAEEYSIAATKKHEGQYKCKIATQENVEVTHTIRVTHPTPHHQALGVQNSSTVN